MKYATKSSEAERLRAKVTPFEDFILFKPSRADFTESSTRDIVENINRE